MISLAFSGDGDEDEEWRSPFYIEILCSSMTKDMG